jgi:hypothetical protein
VTIAGLQFAAANIVIRGTGKLVITGALVWNAGFFDIPVEIRGSSCVVIFRIHSEAVWS